MNTNLKVNILSFYKKQTKRHESTEKVLLLKSLKFVYSMRLHFLVQLPLHTHTHMSYVCVCVSLYDHPVSMFIYTYIDTGCSWSTSAIYDPLAAYPVNQSKGDFRYCCLKICVRNWLCEAIEFSRLPIQWKHFEIFKRQHLLFIVQIDQCIQKPSKAL